MYLRYPDEFAEELRKADVGEEERDIIRELIDVVIIHPRDSAEKFDIEVRRHNDCFDGD
ncbi:hypothetical protein JDN40_16820 [Rhodomicrobium vannielii ATCC 17100]|uniref:hypothetical protein n=1 Tax=Rhodomicrobium vannielii TaxID=1069 RepID=UPI001917AE0A|nr:hypothetical protein [Rhodomicrobium vannielii]MBJ7535772.1 hypothetical protein [Rhodomicrobium vannielii ATCC 17100]